MIIVEVCMKELKKILNKTSKFIYKLLDKVSSYIKDDDNALLIKSIIKVIVLLVIYFALGFVADLIINIGSYIIYQVGTTARGVLSSVWATVVNFTYFLFIIASLYRLNEMAEKDKDFLVFSKNRNKDKKTKEKIYITIESVIKILGTIILVPIFVIDIGLLFGFGIMVGYARQGIYVYSAFGIVIGLIIFFTSVIFLIKTLLSPGKNNLKKYIYSIIIAGLLVAVGSVTILFEVSPYETVDSLTSDFSSSVVKYEYKLNKDDIYVIDNNNSDMNMTLIVDDDMGSYMDVVIYHYDTNEVKSSLKRQKGKVRLSYDEELDLELSDFENIFNLAVNCVKEKRLYNYTLLKYAKIEVRVSSDYAKNIKFVNNSGREYIPYERIDR